uniref:Uncharacterized protein n=1 Tax=Anopheles atroparvus TaxID=41427 RepID=A0A182IZE5_ANOAO
MQADARISPKVIALQRGLYDELQALERSALIANHGYASSDGSAFGQLRMIFHEFDRQNQESITAILRVLALVDHTLENTIKDCEKIFDLPSLESENIIFRDVTRPLLLRVAELCRQISSDELSGLEATMEAVEEEANGYRERLDAAREDMRTVLEQLEKLPEALWIVNKIEGPVHRMKLRNVEIESSIMEAVQNISHRQGLLRASLLDAIAQSSHDSDDTDLITSFLEGWENETSVLAEDLSEQLQMWNNQTEDTLHMIATEVEAILHNLIESPVTAFLEGENSLKCLAEYYTNVAVQAVVTGLENIFLCFGGEDALAKPLETIVRLLALVENDVDSICQDLQDCFRSDGTHQAASTEMMSCFEAAEPILDATEDFIEAKMNEIFFHLEDAVFFEELQTEACLYYKARELMMSEAFINLRYRRCNGAEEPSSQESLGNSQYIPV